MNSAVPPVEHLRASFAIPRSEGPLLRQRRIPGISWLHDGPRGHLVAMIGEFAGTFLFLFFAFTGTQVANMSSAAQGKGPEPSVLLFIALSFGFSLAVNVWVFFRISGGLFNPAVSPHANRRLQPVNGLLGYSWALPRRSSRVAERRPRLYFTNHWSNCSSSCSIRIITWTSACSNNSKRRSKDELGARRLY
jgi:hypothetical protein